MNKIKVLLAVSALGVVGFAHGSADAATQEFVDLNYNGISDVVLIDRWEDGSYDIGAFDRDENGVVEFITLDLNNDGWLEIAFHDISQNGIIDVYTWDLDGLDGWENTALDLNENGVADNVEHNAAWSASGAPAIGPVTNPTGLGAALGTGGDILGPWFGSPDWDEDGTYDYNDYFPDDPDCNSATDAC